MNRKTDTAIDKSARTPKTPVRGKKNPENDLEAHIVNSSQSQTHAGLPISDVPKKAVATCHVDAQQAKTATLLLQSPETHIVLESLNCLLKFCKRRSENKKHFIEINGLIEARKLIFSENQIIQRLSLKLIAICSTIHEATLQIRDLDFAKDLLTLATFKDDVLVEYATFILSSLAMLYTGRLQIIQNGGLPILINLLSHQDPDIQKNCAETIWRMTDEALNLDLITAKEPMEAVLKLANTEYPALQIVILSILEKVSSREPGIQVLDSLEVIFLLEEMLAKPNLGDLHQPILRTLINFAMNQETIKKVIPVTPAVIQVLDSQDIRTQINAWGLLGILSSDKKVIEALSNFDFFPIVISVIASHENDEMREAAVFCLTQLTRYDHAAKREFVAREAVNALVKFVKHVALTKTGFENTMMAFYTLLDDTKKAVPSFINSNGLQLFKVFLETRENYSYDGIISLITCLPMMTDHSQFRDECVQIGLVPTLIDILKSCDDPQALVVSANALCGMLCESLGRRQFIDFDGYGVLVKLISHSEYPVIVSVIPLIHVLGGYSDIAQYLIKKGIFQEMWKRQDLVGKNSPLRTSFERLISKQLSMKYGFTGHIDQFEKVGNGFYDLGSLSLGNNCIPVLSEFTWEKRDPQRKVIYLNWDSSVGDKAALQNNKSLQVMREKGQNCQQLMETIKKEMPNISSEKSLVQSIAKVVSDRFGGHLDKWKVGAHAEDLEIANLQIKFESVVIPISMISTGSFRCRAIIFKALCDIFGIPCSLERGEYRKTWNVVLLQSKKLQKPMCPCEEDLDTAKSLVFTEKLRRFVVDLVYQPGTLLPANSHEANSYCCN